MEKNSSHLSFAEITDLAAGAPVSGEAKSHLRSCPQCGLTLARVAAFIGIMKTDATEEVPAYAFAAVLRAFDERATPPPPQTASIRQKLRAVLRFDTALATPNFGFRSAGASDSRQLFFFAGDGTLDLRIAPTPDGWTISGQSLGEIFDGKVELQGEEINLVTEFDSQSHFILPPIPRGIYRLRLYSQSFEVEVPDLVIG